MKKNTILCVFLVAVILMSVMAESLVASAKECDVADTGYQIFVTDY